MTAKETIEQLEYLLLDEAIPSTEAIELAIKALQKQIPSLVVENDTISNNWFICPVCHKNVLDRYCQYCGQRLDWTDK